MNDLKLEKPGYRNCAQPKSDSVPPFFRAIENRKSKMDHATMGKPAMTATVMTVVSAAKCQYSVTFVMSIS